MSKRTRNVAGVALPGVENERSYQDAKKQLRSGKARERDHFEEPEDEDDSDMDESVVSRKGGLNGHFH